MQFIGGLWLDLKDTEIGRSGAAYAQAQIIHAKALHAPVWGWSASTEPQGGYLGWAGLKDEVVTPHATALAIQINPTEAVSNLRKFEDLGVRSPDKGFYDAYNWKNKAVSKQFLMLDQGMLFISLANHLQTDCIRAAFNSAPLVRRGISLTKLKDS